LLISIDPNSALSHHLLGIGWISQRFFHLGCELGGFEPLLLLRQKWTAEKRSGKQKSKRRKGVRSIHSGGSRGNEDWQRRDSEKLFQETPRTSLQLEILEQQLAKPEHGCREALP
jgi:hypothetical protein